MKKTGFNGYVYDFSVDYDAIAVDNILDIHKYLTKKNNNMIHMKMFGFIKKKFFYWIISFVISYRLSTNQLGCISMNNQECKVRNY